MADHALQNSTALQIPVNYISSEGTGNSITAVTANFYTVYAALVPLQSVTAVGNMDAACDDRTGGEAREYEGGGDNEENENFNGHGVHLFVLPQIEDRPLNRV
jgi:hypothetical protein